MAWLKASMPVWAVTRPSMVESSSGSEMEISGISDFEMIVILILRSLSAIMENWDTSEPEPEVEGSTISGGSGL